VGLEKLGFPWILSCEMSLFNRLRANFPRKILFGPFFYIKRARAAQTSDPFLGQEPQGSKRHFSHSIASGNNPTITHISEFGNITELVVVSDAFGANWIQLAPQSPLPANRGSHASRPKRSLGRLAIDIEGKRHDCGEPKASRSARKVSTKP
jgi:hypothetical protein